MTKLTDTQLVILSAACQRSDRLVLPLPAHIKGGAVQKVVAGLLSRGLVEEAKAGRDAPLWREPGDGNRITLVATNAALEALGIEPEVEASAGTTSAGEPAAGAPTGDDGAPVDATPKRRGRPRKAAPTGPDTAAPRKTRDGTKQAQVIAMLRRREGATIAQIVEGTGWRAHTVRGFFAGALKKKLGLEVTSEKVEGRGRVYRIV